MIDLHVHSTASDGEFAPVDVVRHAATVGVTILALTDHDTLSGVAAAVEAGAASGIRVIPGCEFSVDVPWGEMHLLGYFLNPDDEGLASFLEAQRVGRLRRATRIVDRLRKIGKTLTIDDVLAESHGDAVGRPHVARALKRRGHVGNVQDAFVRYIGYGRAAFVPKDLPSVEEVTSVIRASGGVSSAAHLGVRATPAGLERLKVQGLDGVEVLHPAHDELTRRRIETMAVELSLLKTGGSDWHGPLEEGDRAPLGSVGVPEEWVRILDETHAARMTELEVG